MKKNVRYYLITFGNAFGRNRVIKADVLSKNFSSKWAEQMRAPVEIDVELIPNISNHKLRVVAFFGKLKKTTIRLS